MKTNLFKSIFEKSSSLPKKTATLLTLITVTLLTLAFSASASVEMRVENYNNCEKYLQKLGEEANLYIGLDNEPTKTTSGKVTEAINEYRNEILALQTHPDIETRSLEKETLLAYTKGVAAGKLAWIYYYNVYVFTSDESANRIEAKYEDCKNAVANATQYTVLEAETAVLCAELNSKIYVERSQNLALPSDSLSAKSLISGAIERIKLTSDSDVRAKELKQIYDKLVNDLSLQRARDALIGEIEKAFLYIRPAESLSSSSEFALFAYNLNESTSIKEMNGASIACLEALVAPDDSKPYSSVTKNQYIATATTLANRATETLSPANFEGVFDSYPLSLKKASTKDSIYALLLGNGSVEDAKLKNMEAEFNAKGGRVDACATAEQADAELTNAKARLFLYRHAEIYEKEPDALTHEDEALARNALVAYEELEDTTKTALLTEINTIAEKYNIILEKKITSILPNDTLYLDLCEKIKAELKSVPRKDIAVFYNTISRIPEKAYALARVIEEYREISGSEHYDKLTSEELTEITKSIEDFSERLSAISTADFGVYSDEIEDEKSLAIRAMNATSQCARVRIAGRDSSNPSVADEIAAGYEKIKGCTSKSEILSQAERAIFKIQRIITSDEVIKKADSAKAEINDLEFITEEERISLHESIDPLLSYSNDAKIAENLSALEALWKKFTDERKAILDKANAIDLSRASTAYSEKISEDTQKTVEKLEALEFIKSEKREEIYNLILEKKSSAIKEINNCRSTAEIVELHQKLLASYSDLLLLAESADTESYKEALLSELKKYEDLKSNYSDENYNKILALRDELKLELEKATTKEECKSLVDATKIEIEKINDLLDDEKDATLATLEALILQYKSDSALYSQESLASIENLGTEAKIRIESINDISKIASVKETLSYYTALLKAVNKSVIYTSKDAYNISQPSLQYPQEYDTASGLWGSIEASNALVSDAVLEIKELKVANIDEITKLIQKAAKEGSISSSTSLTEEKLKLLSSAKIGMAIDVTLSKTSDVAQGYSLKLLLPQKLLSENVIGIVFVTEKNTVEFYSIEQINSLLSANLNHLSRYYIVVEGTIDVGPFLIFLILLIIAEFIVLSLIIYLKKSKNRKQGGEANMSNLPMAGFMPTSIALTRVRPENGVIIAIFLSIAALTLGIAIVLMLKKDVAVRKKNDQKLLSAPKKQKLLQKGKEIPRLTEAESEGERADSDAFYGDNKIFCTVGASKDDYRRNTADNAEIDLDTIENSFDSGETVNMQTLKFKGIVDGNVRYVKILAKGRLTKPLRVEANEFSNTAKEILEASGGEAKEI